MGPFENLVVVRSESISSNHVNVVEHTTDGLEGATVDFDLVDDDGTWLIDQITDNS